MATTSITVDQIVGGAEAIRKMRQSTETVIRTVVGLISGEDLERYRGSDEKLVFQYRWYKWKIDMITPRERDHAVWIYKVSIVWGKQEDVWLIFSPDTNKFDQ